MSQGWEDQVLEIQDPAYREPYIVGSAHFGDALEGLSEVIRDSVDSVVVWCRDRLKLSSTETILRGGSDALDMMLEMSDGVDEAPGMLLRELLDESTLTWLDLHRPS